MSSLNSKILTITVILLTTAIPTEQMTILRNNWMFGDPSSTNHYHPAVLDSPHKHSPSTFFDETHNPHLQALIDEAKQQDLQLPQPPSPPTSDQHHDTTRQAEKNQVNHLDHIDSDEKAMESLMLWFSIHDLDSNDLLDGHELLKVFAEWAVQEGGLKQFNSIGDRQQPYNEMLVRMTELVDHVLIEDDTNGDGYIDIQEFLNSHDL